MVCGPGRQQGLPGAASGGRPVGDVQEQVKRVCAAAPDGKTQITFANSGGGTSARINNFTAPATGVITAVNLTVGQAPPTSAITMRTDGLTVTVDVADPASVAAMVVV